MRISFVTACADYTGGFRVIVTHAERLMRKGHDVLIATRSGPDRSLVGSLLSLATHGKLNTSRLPPSHLDGKQIPVHVVPGSRPIQDGDLPDADVVIATWWETAEWVASLNASKGAKAYFIQHHETFDYLPQARVAATYRLPLAKIVVSRWLQGLMRDRYNDDTAALVPNSVDFDLFHCEPRVRGEPPTIGIIYSSTPWKASDVATRAIARARHSVPNLRVVAFGTESLRDQRSLPPGTEYHSKPPQDLIRQIYSRCDVWMCSSQAEGFALPPLEAMACRCPVVSTAVGGLTDVIKDSENGYLVAPGDEEGLANRLVRILRMRSADWSAMSERALQSVSRYTWDHACDRMQSALLTIIQPLKPD